MAREEAFFFFVCFFVFNFEDAFIKFLFSSLRFSFFLSDFICLNSFLPNSLKQINIVKLQLQLCLIIAGLI